MVRWVNKTHNRLNVQQQSFMFVCVCVGGGGGGGVDTDGILGRYQLVEQVWPIVSGTHSFGTKMGRISVIPLCWNVVYGATLTIGACTHEYYNHLHCIY